MRSFLVMIVILASLKPSIPGSLIASVSLPITAGTSHVQDIRFRAQLMAQNHMLLNPIATCALVGVKTDVIFYLQPDKPMILISPSMVALIVKNNALSSWKEGEVETGSLDKIPTPSPFILLVQFSSNRMLWVTYFRNEWSPWGSFYNCWAQRKHNTNRFLFVIDFK